MPRVVLVLVWLSGYLDVYQTKLWPFLGFFLMPLTTLAYAFALHQGGGSPSPIGIGLVAVAVLLDLGLIRTGAKARKKEISVKGERVG